MSILSFVVVATLAVDCGDPPPKAPAAQEAEAPVTNQISKATLEELFANIREKSPSWDLKGPMLWGYFFTDSDRAALERAAKKLEADGYRFVDVFQPEDDGKPLPYFFMHVEKVETHSVDSLYKRNTRLEAFAKQNGLDTYDGMDVGPVKPAGDKAK